MCPRRTVCSLLLCAVLAPMSLALGGCVTTERIISTEMVQVGKVLVAPSPPGEVFVNGRSIGKSPIQVVIRQKRHTVERVEKKAGDNIDDALMVGAVQAAVFPPAAILAFLVYAEDGGFIKTEREIVQRDEAITHTIEVRRRDYLSDRLDVSSDRSPLAWRPVLEMTAVAKAEHERKRKAVEAAHRKAIEKRRRRAQAARLARKAEMTSHDIRKTMAVLDDIVNDSVKTHKALLRKEWQPSR